MIATQSPPVILAPSGRPAIQELALSNRLWSYDFAEFSQDRTWIFAPVQDQTKDLDPYTRHEGIKHSRHLWRNSPFIRGLIRRLIIFTIGSGINPVPDSSDPTWNRRALGRWRQIARRPVINQKWNWRQYQAASFASRLVDGEAYTLKTFDKRGRNKIQGVPTHRVANTGQNADERAIDGIVYDEVGRPRLYYVSTDLKGEEVRKIPADLMVHHCSADILGQKRGEPILASAINTARDVQDILNLEKLAVKDASSKTDIIKTKTGELPMEDLIRSRITLAGSQDRGTSGGSSEARDVYYSKLFGPEAKVLRQGDEWNGYEPKRPGSAWQGFMDFLANTICLSTGVPPSVVLPIKVGGADTRRDIAAAARVFELWQDDIVDECEELYFYLMNQEIFDGPLSTHLPSDWWKVKWMRPKSITVDSGREADSDRKDVAMGLMSRQEYHGRWSESEEDVEDQIIKEAKRMKQKLADAELSIEEFGTLLSLNPSLVKDADEPKPTTAPASDNPPNMTP